MMKILLTGASGLLGRAVFREFSSKDNNYDITGTAYSRKSGSLIKLDILDEVAVNKLVTNLRPDLIIHTAAERRPDVVKDNPERSQRLNVDAVGTIARAAVDCGAAIIYISTNYVFDGKNPPYYPDSKTNPLNDYGIMKLAGEKKVAKECPKAIILRIPILYGHVEFLSESAVTIIADGLSADKDSYFDNKMIRFPTHADDISRIIRGIADLLHRGETVSGIYQWSAEQAYTKYEMAGLMAEILRLDPSLIKEAGPDPEAAPRPQNAKLDSSRLRAMGLGSELDFKQALTSILGQSTA